MTKQTLLQYLVKAVNADCLNGRTIVGKIAGEKNRIRPVYEFEMQIPENISREDLDFAIEIFLANRRYQNKGKVIKNKKGEYLPEVTRYEKNTNNKLELYVNLSGFPGKDISDRGRYHITITSPNRKISQERFQAGTNSSFMFEKTPRAK